MKNSQLRADLYYSNQSDNSEFRNGQPNDIISPGKFLFLSWNRLNASWDPIRWLKNEFEGLIICCGSRKCLFCAFDGKGSIAFRDFHLSRNFHFFECLVLKHIPKSQVISPNLTLILHSPIYFSSTYKRKHMMFSHFLLFK